MRIAHVAFLSMFPLTCYCQESPSYPQVAGDNPIYQIAKHYFRSNPYNVHFSAFLNHLLNDPTLSNKSMNKRTDTSFFFFRGDYASHNPYSFKANRTEIRLAESEVNMGDSLSTIDTLLFYQLIGYSYGATGTEAVKKEFSKFDRKYGKSFYSEDSVLKKGDEITGIAKNYYFLFASLLSPLSISWLKLDDYQSAFIITFRLKIIENSATLPIFPDHD
jgi:hypothetical protein